MQKASLIAWTHFDSQEFFNATGFMSEGETGADLAEAAGRLCYLSWKRPNPETATLWGYIKNILKQRHYSVLEHGTATFLFQGVSRSLTHELIRHRHFSYSEVSQRFVNVEDADYVIPPALRKAYRAELASEIGTVQEESKYSYRKIVEYLIGISDGRKSMRKQAREAARSVLPNMMETKIVVTGNYRAWRHFLKVRGSIHADAEIRELAVKVATVLISHAPAVFQDVNIDIVDGFECVSVGESEDS